MMDFNQTSHKSSALCVVVHDTIFKVIHIMCVAELCPFAYEHNLCTDKFDFCTALTLFVLFYSNFMQVLFIISHYA